MQRTVLDGINTLFAVVSKRGSVSLLQYFLRQFIDASRWRLQVVASIVMARVVLCSVDMAVWRPLNGTDCVWFVSNCLCSCCCRWNCIYRTGRETVFDIYVSDVVWLQGFERRNQSMFIFCKNSNISMNLTLTVNENILNISLLKNKRIIYILLTPRFHI